MSINATECHGPQSIPNVPPAGTDPWEWLWSSTDVWLLCIGDAMIGTNFAETRWSRGKPFVLMRQYLSPTQRRCTVAHELHYIAIGGVCASNCQKNEKRVQRATARFLLPDLARVRWEVARASGDTTAAARHLGVVPYIVRERLAALPKTRQPAEAETVDAATPGLALVRSLPLPRLVRWPGQRGGQPLP